MHVRELDVHEGEYLFGQDTKEEGGGIFFRRSASMNRQPRRLSGEKKPISRIDRSQSEFDVHTSIRPNARRSKRRMFPTPQLSLDPFILSEREREKEREMLNGSKVVVVPHHRAQARAPPPLIKSEPGVLATKLPLGTAVDPFPTSLSYFSTPPQTPSGGDIHRSETVPVFSSDQFPTASEDPPEMDGKGETKGGWEVAGEEPEPQDEEVENVEGVDVDEGEDQEQGGAQPEPGEEGIEMQEINPQDIEKDPDTEPEEEEPEEAESEDIKGNPFELADKDAEDERKEREVVAREIIKFTEVQEQKKQEEVEKVKRKSKARVWLEKGLEKGLEKRREMLKSVKAKLSTPQERSIEDILKQADAKPRSKRVTRHNILSSFTQS